MNIPDLYPLPEFNRTEACYRMAFTEAWQRANLPAQCYNTSGDALLCDLQDTINGRHYTVRVPAIYEGEKIDQYEAEPYWEGGMVALQEYFYFHHYCDCHRKTDAAQQCGVDCGSECQEQNRFIIERIYSERAPHVTLYSETQEIKLPIQAHTRSPSIT